jgi:hypothetical protein
MINTGLELELKIRPTLSHVRRISRRGSVCDDNEDVETTSADARAGPSTSAQKVKCKGKAQAVSAVQESAINDNKNDETSSSAASGISRLLHAKRKAQDVSSGPEPTSTKVW